MKGEEERRREKEQKLVKYLINDGMEKKKDKIIKHDRRVSNNK